METKFILNWNELPKWVNWFSKDSNGECWCFERKPIKEKFDDHNEGYWGLNKKGGESQCVFIEEELVTDWEDTLEKRPNKSS